MVYGQMFFVSMELFKIEKYLKLPQIPTSPFSSKGSGKFLKYFVIYVSLCLNLYVNEALLYFAN